MLIKNGKEITEEINEKNNEKDERHKLHRL